MSFIIYCRCAPWILVFFIFNFYLFKVKSGGINLWPSGPQYF